MSASNVIQLADRRPATCQIVIRNVYGNDLIYPSNDEARIFAEIAGTKTLSKTDLARIEQLGFRVEQVSHQVRI